MGKQVSIKLASDSHLTVILQFYYENKKYLTFCHD
jgi:hypothetical protein